MLLTFGGYLHCVGQPEVTTVRGMDSVFESIRGLGFRRGPQRVVAGIGGSLAERYGLNVWLVRLLILVSFLLPVIGVGLYAVVWAFTPWQDGTIPAEQALGGPRDQA